MFTKECLRIAFEKLSKVDKWDKYCVKGGRWINDRFAFDSHEEMINKLISNDELLDFINENEIKGLPCFQLSTDSDIGRLLQSEKDYAAGQYDVHGYITKAKVFKIGSCFISATFNYIDIINEYVTYITEDGDVFVCDEWRYIQRVTDIIDKTILSYRTMCIKVGRKNVSCDILEDFFDEFLLLRN